jgi:hypothetical protein
MTAPNFIGQADLEMGKARRLLDAYFAFAFASLDDPEALPIFRAAQADYNNRIWLEGE